MNNNSDTENHRKVIYTQMMSLDGFIEGPNQELDWSEPDEELFGYIIDQEKLIDTHLYGRLTYENMASYWPYADMDPESTIQEVEWAKMWKRIPKIVFSNTLNEVSWNASLIKGNISEVIKNLKAQPGTNLSLGGSGIAATFMQLNLIDEYWLYIHPVVLGEGKPMFRVDKIINLKLSETRIFRSGVVLLRYSKISANR